MEQQHSVYFAINNSVTVSSPVFAHNAFNLEGFGVSLALGVCFLVPSSAILPLPSGDVVAIGFSPFVGTAVAIVGSAAF